jgi:hypothetical protein
LNKCQSYNFVVKRGATKVFTVEYTNASGSIIPITNYNARMQLREEPDSGIVLQLNSTGSTANRSTLTVTAPSGSVRVYISAADTNTLTADSYVYDLELYTSSDPYSQSDPEYVIRLLQGMITTTYNVTR